MLIIYLLLMIVFIFVFPPVGILMIIYLLYCLVPNKKDVGKTSIHIVMGKTGIGKTTYLALKAKDYIKKGIPVYSNVPIVGCYKIDAADLGKYDIRDCLLIIDEAGLSFNARDYKQFTKNLYGFFTLHRHYRIHCILSVQFWDRLDIVIRELVHRIFILQPSIFNKQILKCVEVGNKIDIDENGVIVQRFHYIPSLFGGVKYYIRRFAWSMFETHSVNNLPPFPKLEMYTKTEVEAEKNEVEEKLTVKEKVLQWQRNKLENRKLILKLNRKGK